MANLMDLVRELKALNAKKKSGVALTPEEVERRKSLKDYLQTAMNNPPSSREGRPATGSHSISREKSATGSHSISREKSTTGSHTISREESTNPFDEDTSTNSPHSSHPSQGVLVSREGTPVHGTPMISSPSIEKSAPALSPFAINATDILNAAASSEAVQRAATSRRSAPPQPALDTQEGAPTDYSMPSATFRRADERDIMSAEQKAIDAVKQNKTRPRVTKPEDVQKTLHEVASASGYTPSSQNLAFEQYYSAYHDDGFDSLDDMAPVDLPTVDPRNLARHMLTLDHPLAKRPPQGLAFLDDFDALYKRHILPPPDATIDIDSNDTSLLIPGRRKVTLHLLNGQIVRGSILKLEKNAHGVTLNISGKNQDFALTQIKALFVHLKSGQSVNPQGQPMQVVFKDNRGVKGHSDDYSKEATLFSIVPASKYERIVVPSTSVKSIR